MKYYLLVFALLLSTFQLYAQKVVERSLSKDAIIADLHEYARTISREHIDPFTHISKKDFLSKIDELETAGDSCNTDELLVRWLQINALIGDAHTNIQVHTQYAFPFSFNWYSDGMYIIATNDDNRKYYHSRIIAINNIPFDEIVKRFNTIIPDSMIRSQLGAGIINPILLHGLHITQERDKVTFTFLMPDGTTVQATPQPLDIRDYGQITGYKSAAFLRTAQSGPYWFKYLDTAKTIYFNYHKCFDNGNFQYMIDQLEKAIEEKHPQKIVIDMRYNSGGNSSLLDPFIKYLNTSYLNKRGSIYVLIGPRTFSSAVLNVASLKAQTGAILLGEPVGQAANHFGEIKKMKLSHTGLEVTYSTKHFHADDNSGRIRPDVYIPESFADYDKNIDAVVDYALSH